MVELTNSDPHVLDALVTCDESWIYCYDPETKRQSFQWKHAGSPRPKKARQSKSTQKLMMIPFFDSMGIIYIHWVPTGITVNKEYYIEVLREFRKRFRRKRPELFESGQWHFHQNNTPVHNSILVRLFDPDGHEDDSPFSLQPGPCSLRLLAIPKAQGKPQRQSLFHN